MMKTFIIILFSAFATAVFAQSGETITIEGTVASDDASPIVNAKVKAVELSNPDLVDSTMTDMAGFYQLELGILTGIDDNAPIPKSFSLAQNYPNPFSNNTNISFTTEKSGNAKLEVYNVLGQKVTTLFDNKVSSNQYSVNWDGRNFNGKQITSGVYFYRLTFDNQVISKKMLFNDGQSLAPQINASAPQNSRSDQNTLSKVFADYTFQISVSHPDIATIIDTLETNANQSTYTVNYSISANLPPLVRFGVEETGSHSFIFDGSISTDDNDALEDLVFQCDLDGDGVSDIPGGEDAWQESPSFSHTFTNDGPWDINIRAKDGDGAISNWVYRNINRNYTGYPSDVLPFFDEWRITMGNGSSRNDLINYEHEDYFYNTNNSTDWIVYKTPNSGGTTPNSSNTRSELRQFEEWTPETGGKMTGTLKVMHVSTTGDARVPATFSTVIGQIHSDQGHENEPLKIFYKKFPNHTKGSVFWNYEINTDGSNSERWDYSTAVWGYDWSVVGASANSYPEEPADGIELGEEFSYEVNVYEGVMYLTFMSDGHETKTFTKSLVESEYTEYSDIPEQVLTVFSSTGQDGTELANAYSGELQYFKQGGYNQTNGKDPADNMVWNTGAETYGGSLTEQYAKGSFTEVWFKAGTLGPGTAP